MRPLKLTITGFEAYSRKCEIDFTAFGDGTLYLITGNTGAGKTTIFDAITYALYGEPSGTARKEKMLRTVNAGPETPTEVDFTFEFKKQKYRIRRNPDYVGMAKNGKGTKSIAADATMWDQDGAVLADSKSKVTAYVENLLSLTKNQFCRIAMIAQGDFYNVLNADTKDRKEIYSKIFGTGLFNELQKRIGEEAKKAREESEVISRTKNQAVAEIQIPEGYDGSGLSGTAADDELNRSLEALLEYDGQRQKEVSAGVDEIQARIKSAEQKLDDTRNLEKQRQNLEFSRRSLKDQEEECEKAEKNLNEQVERQGEADRLHAQFTLINESLSKYDSLDEKKKKQNQNAALINRKTEHVEELKKSSGLLEQAVEAAKEKINSYSGVEVEMEKCSTAKEKITEEGTKLRDMLDEIEKLDGLKAEYRDLLDEYKNASDKATQGAQEYSRALKAFLDAQAGLLAEELEDGKPCPVCGSTEHPRPAEVSAEAPGQDEIERLKKRSEKLEKDAREKSIGAGNMEGEVKTKTAEIESKLLAMNMTGGIQGSEKELTERRDQLREEYRKQDERMKTLKSNLEEKTRLQKKIDDSQQELEQNTEAVHREETEVAELKASVNENSKAIRELQESLPYPDRTSAQKAAEEASEKIRQIKEDLDAARKKSDECREEISRLQGTILEQEKNINELERKLSGNRSSISEQEEALGELRQKHEGMSAELDAIKIRLVQNRGVAQKLKGLQEKLVKTRETYRWMSDLDSVAGGKMTENGKIDLETYVQISIFDRILYFANQRLRDIAGNQYTLVRRQKSDDNRSAFALDLDIQDSFSGKVRPVQGLSGGETFEASLALALGLADEIQANAGGIELDCMFIDEGFGSLSEEPLNKAVNCLYSLAQGKKLVGIISHVESLDSRIDDKIAVSKDPVTGSTARVISSRA